jgi:hypothetical protein
VEKSSENSKKCDPALKIVHYFLLGCDGSDQIFEVPIKGYKVHPKYLEEDEGFREYDVAIWG